MWDTGSFFFFFATNKHITYHICTYVACIVLSFLIIVNGLSHFNAHLYDLFIWLSIGYSYSEYIIFYSIEYIWHLPFLIFSYFFLSLWISFLRCIFIHLFLDLVRVLLFSFGVYCSGEQALGGVPLTGVTVGQPGVMTFESQIVWVRCSFLYLPSLWPWIII